MRPSPFPALLLTALLSGSFAHAQDASNKSSGNTLGGNTLGGAKAGASATGAVTAPLIMATDPGYRLSLGDEISIVVHGEDEMSSARRVDKDGVKMPLVDDKLYLNNKTVREAETFIEQLLVEKKLLKKPLVNITVREYARREIVISGSGLSPGMFPLPRETESIEITELVTRLGGFRPTAKSDAVKVIHTDDSGKDQTRIIDVESMIAGKKNALKSFLIYPGDRIYVEERLF